MIQGSLGGPRLRWMVVGGAFLGMVSFSLSRHLYPYVLPSMQADMGLSNERAGNIASAYFIAYTLTTYLWGMASDRMGSRRPMLLGILLIALGLFGMGFSNSFPVAFGLYLLCGAGAAGLSVPQVPLLTQWFGGGRRGTAIGLAITGSGFGAFALGLTAPSVLSAHSWRWVWWLAAGAVLGALLVCWVLLRERPSSSLPALDDESASALGRGGPSPRGVSPGGGVAMLAVLRRGVVWILAGLYATWGMGYVVFMTFAIAYLQQQGWAPAAAAGAFAVWGAFYMVGPPLWGAAGDRLPKKHVFSVVLALQAVGMLSFLTGTSLGAYLGAAIVGFGLIGVPTTMSAAAGDYFESRVTGSAFGLVTLVFGLGCIVGPSIGGFLADATGSLQAALLFALAADVGAFLITLVLPRPATAQARR